MGKEAKKFQAKAKKKKKKIHILPPYNGPKPESTYESQMYLLALY